MATPPQAQVRRHRYISGWCSATRHDRCKGSYAGTACACPCHAPESASRDEAALASDPPPPSALPQRRARARRQAHEHVLAVRSDAEHGDRPGGRRRQHPAGREVKAGAVQPALDRAVRPPRPPTTAPTRGCTRPAARTARRRSGRGTPGTRRHPCAPGCPRRSRPGGTPAPSRPRPPARSPATIACSQRRQARPGPLMQQLRQPGAAIHDRRLRRDGVPGGFMGRDGQVTAPSGRPGFLSVADRSIYTRLACQNIAIA